MRDQDWGSNSRIEQMANDVRSMRDMQRRAGKREWLRLALESASLVGLVISTSLTYGSAFAVLFGGISLFLLLMIAASVVSAVKASSAEGKAERNTTLRERQLRVLTTMKGQVDAILRHNRPSEIPAFLDTYYDALRIVCTIIRDDKPSLFDTVLWDYWQVAAVPRPAIRDKATTE